MTPTSVLDYYEAFEHALSSMSGVRQEYRRHFGCSETPPPPGYCWFKGAVSPERHAEFADWGCEAVQALEDRFLAELPRLQPKSVLDIGCGNGALLQHLADTLPEASLTGINFQSTQVQAARRLLAGRAEVVEADFLQHSFERRFELVCLVESAFHMPDKAELCRRIANVLEPMGEVWLLDIVIAERASGTFNSLGREQTLFNYVPRDEWRRRFGEHNLEETEFLDLSRPIAEFLQVSNIDVLRDEYFLPRLRSTPRDTSLPSQPHPEPKSFVDLMVQIATQYRRLSRLLRGGMLQYVLMRYRAQG
jgi:2-polyprenyl-3-methyl-5-hydroxy-6-metoxy-1,4-benzoquinol methylase